MSISVKDISVSIGGSRSTKFNIEIGGCKYTMSGFHLTERLMDHSYLSFDLVRDPMESISDTQFQACADIIGQEVELTLQTDSVEVEMPGFSGGDKVAAIEFKGYVRGASASRYNSSYTVHVNAVSWDGILDDSPDCHSWLDMQLKDIIEETLSKSSKLESQVDPAFADDQYTYCVKWNETSYGFIQRMAARHGEWLFHDGKKLYFGKLPEKDSVQLAYPSRDMTSYSVSMETRHLNFSHIAANEVIDDTCTHKNIDEMSDSINKLNDAAFAKSQELYPQTTMHNLIAGGFTWEQNGEENFQKALDTPQAKGMRGGLLYYYGNTECSKLSVGVKLTVVDNYINDEQSNGKSDVSQDEILITSVSHSFDSDESYQNSFSGLSAAVQFPPYANADAIPRALSCRAWVKDNNDPEKMGRVRVFFPWGQQGPNNDAEEMLTPWIRVEQAYAGTDRGAYIIPEKNDEVMVDFEGGNAEMPYVRSSHFNCQSHMDNDWADDKTVPANQIKAIRTRNGHTIEIHDEGPNGYIRIYDYQKENYILTFSTDEKLIKLESTGNIELYAKKNIIMKAGHNINASAGSNVNVSAGSNISRKAGANISEDAGGSISESAANNISESAGGSINDSAGGDIAMKAGSNIAAGAGSNFTASAGENFNASAGQDIEQVAANNALLSAQNDLTLNSNNDMMFIAANDGFCSITGNYNFRTNKNLTVEIVSSGKFQALKDIEISAINLTEKATNEFRENSVSHQISATNAVGINATTSIDLKALMIKEN